VTDDNTYRNQVRFVGGGATTITSDSAGTITITSTDTNTNTDTKVTSVGNHYSPTSSTTKSAAAGTATDITNGSGVAVISGIKMDAAGHVVDVVSTTLKSTNTNTDTNTAHSHSAGVGLTGSGNAGTSGTYTYKAKLRSETAFTVDSTGATTGATSKIYPVAVDKSGYLSVYVPWTDTDTNTDTKVTSAANHYNPGFTGTSLTKSTSGANYYLTGVTLTLDGKGHVTALGGGEAYDDDNNTNYYLTGVTGSGNGNVTFGVKGHGNVTWDASHSHNYVSTAGGSVVAGTTNFNKIQISGAGATYGTGATLFFGNSESEVYLRNTADKDLTIYANGTLNLNGGSVLINGYTPSRITGATGTVSNTTGTPSVSIATGGTASAQTLSFTFTNIKGAKGDTGNPGTNGTDGDDGFGIYYANTTTSTSTTTISKIYITTNSRTPQIGDFILSYNGFLYKITSGWTTSTSYAYVSYLTTLKGSDGSNGSPGSPGTNGTDGADGLSMFYCSNNYSSSQTLMSRSYLTPSATVKTPIKGDLVITSGGLLFSVTSVSAATLSVSYLTSLKGADGSNGSPGTNGTNGKSVTQVVCTTGLTTTATTTISATAGAINYYRFKDSSGEFITSGIAVKNGANGNSVTQVVCTASLTSTATTTVKTTDGATNYYRFKDSSGGWLTGGITVKNGSKGADGEDGDNGSSSITVTNSDTKGYLMGGNVASGTLSAIYSSSNAYIASGKCYADSFYQTSDERLKEFYEDVEIDFDKLKSIPKKYFTWNFDDEKHRQLGTSAQKIKELYPEIVSYDEEFDKYSVAYDKLSIIALKAIDELHEENKALKTIIEDMDKRLKALENLR
jgi:hypothetical protein